MNEKKSQTRGLRSPPNLQGTTHSACLEQYKHILPTTKKPESSFKDLDIQFLLSNHKAWQPSPVSLYGSSWLPPSCQQMPPRQGGGHVLQPSALSSQPAPLLYLAGIAHATGLQSPSRNLYLLPPRRGRPRILGCHHQPLSLLASPLQKRNYKGY